ncbi:MAG: 50S ribosomal protein L25 [Actinomycetes bacterium]
MAEERVTLAVSKRQILGSAESRRLRKQGIVPGVLYGRDEPIAFAVGDRDLRAVLTTEAGSHAVIDVAIDGGSQHSVILKDYQRDRVRGTITHIDFQEVRLDVTIQTSVLLALVGEPVGVKQGGQLTQVTNEINIEVLPLDVPQRVELDVSGMEIGGTLYLGDLPFAAGVTVLDPLDTVLAHVAGAAREEGDEAAGDEAAAETEAAGDDAEPVAESGDEASTEE